MKNRTPNKNAFISLIPFYGYSSFWYLGTILGLLAWAVSLEVTIAMLVFFILYVDLDPIYTGIIVGGNSNIIQFFLVKILTVKKNKQVEV
jgi:hypothetical protein